MENDIFVLHARRGEDEGEEGDERGLLGMWETWLSRGGLVSGSGGFGGGNGG